MDILSVIENKVLLNSGLTELRFGKTNLSYMLSRDKGTVVEFDDVGKITSFNDWYFSNIETDKKTGNVFFLGDFKTNDDVQSSVDDEAMQASCNTDKTGDEDSVDVDNGFNAIDGTDRIDGSVEVFDSDNTMQTDTETKLLSGDANKASARLKTLKQILESGDEKIIAKTVFIVVNAIKNAITDEKHFANVGAGGIIVANNKLLFLPKVIFETALTSLSKDEKANENEKYIFKGATDVFGLNFLRSVIIYYALCKKLPFEQSDEQKRQEDILDSNFIPIEYEVNGIDAELASAVNAGLTPTNSTSKYDEENASVLLETLRETLGLDEKLNYLTKKRQTQDSTIFEKNKLKFAKKLFFKVQTKRFFYKQKIAIIAGFIVAVLVFAGINSYYKRISNLPTTKGLSSQEVVQMFYTGFHSLDTELMSESSKGKDCQDMINLVSAMFVTVKTRAAYEKNSNTFTPEKWFSYAESANSKNNFWIMGLSDFSIKNSTEEFLPVNFLQTIKKRSEKPLIVTENGKMPEKNATMSFEVSYLRLYTHGLEAKITIERNLDNVVCTFIKNRYLVTSVKSDVLSTEEIPLKQLQEDFAVSLENSQNDTIKACELLRKKYTWIPSESTLIQQKK